MEADKVKWNLRFESEDSYLGRRPSPFLSSSIDRIKRLAPGKRALDIACGEGRNSVFLAQHGFKVTGLDISDVGLGKAVRRAEEAGVSVDYRQVDLEGYRISEQFDLIINFNFLLRGLIPEAVQALSPGGLLIIDTIMEITGTAGLAQPGLPARAGGIAAGSAMGSAGRYFSRRNVPRGRCRRRGYCSGKQNYVDGFPCRCKRRWFVSFNLVIIASLC